MMRLINADELKHDLEWLECDTPVYLDVMSTIDERTTVDAEPVKHGHWINKEISPDVWVCLCSECDDVAYYSMHKVATKFRYCTNCGAKMDGERREDENT